MHSKQKEALVDPRLFANKDFRRQQIKVFLITVTLYCTWHASRTAWAYSKKYVKDSDPYFTDQKMGIFDMCFMLAYALGLFYNGWLGDQSDLKLFIVKGAAISLCGYFGFAILGGNGYFGTLIFAACFLLHGFGQSRGFPGNIAILGNWIESEKRGFLLGLWNASVNIGNIMGQQIGKYTIEVYHSHWSNAMFIAGGTMIIMAVVLYLYVQVNPKEAGLEPVGESTELSTIERSERNGHLRNSVQAQEPSISVHEGIGFWSAFQAPGLLKYCLIFACIKGSTYGLLFWLPDYLQTIMGFGQSTALVTATYEIGQFIGAVTLGYYSDRLGKRSTVVAVALYISSFVFIILAVFGPSCGVLGFASILFLAGIFFGGPEVIVGGVISSDFGEDASLKDDVRSMSTMAGIIDGSGSIGAAIVQMIIPMFKASSFYIYFTLCMMAAILLTPTVLKGWKQQREETPDGPMLDIELQPKGNLKTGLTRKMDHF